MVRIHLAERTACPELERFKVVQTISGAITHCSGRRVAGDKADLHQHVLDLDKPCIKWRCLDLKMKAMKTI